MIELCELDRTADQVHWQISVLRIGESVEFIFSLDSEMTSNPAML
jgi:hypothetical protein